MAKPTNPFNEDPLGLLPKRPPLFGPDGAPMTQQRAAPIQQAAIDVAAHDLYGAWLAFHTGHPEVYRLLETLALELAHQGRKFGVKRIYEDARWDYKLPGSDREFKLSNSYTAYYARLLLERNPGLKGKLTIKTLA